MVIFLHYKRYCKEDEYLNSKHNPPLALSIALFLSSLTQSNNSFSWSFYVLQHWKPDAYRNFRTLEFPSRFQFFNTLKKKFGFENFKPSKVENYRIITG